MTYAVITPARDEADNLPRLARCLALQTVLPEQWVIVDNGSTDGTAALAAHFERSLIWARAVTTPATDALVRGATVVRAVHAGLEALDRPVDVVVKLDADVSFEREYFERLLAAFAAEPGLGIASGSAYEQDDAGVWRQQFATSTNVWGASRAYRRECLDDVLPLEEHMGWDGIDRLKAIARGWRTQTLFELPFRHHRREGERDGARKAWTARGDCFWYMGYRPSYLLLGAIHHALRDPRALAILAGYARAAARRKPRCADPLVRTELRREQRLRTVLRRRREALGEAPSTL